MRIILILLIIFASACVKPVSPIPPRPDALGLNSLEFDIPSVESWKLSNGLKVFYYYNDELPLMQGKMYFPGGALNENTGIAGLAGACGSQMRSGSIEGMKPAVLDKRLDQLAASIESSFGGEYGTVAFFSLSEDFEEVFSLYSKVIRSPAFDKKRLELWQALAAEGVSQRRDHPETMSSMAFAELVFGKGSRFANFISLKSIKQINVQRLREFHNRFVRPDGALLAISGSLPKSVVQKFIQEHFADWGSGALERAPFPTVEHQISPGIYVLERDFDQASVVIGHRGPPRHTADRYAISAFNRIYGHGSFGSMLFRKVRSELGLAYSIYGGIWPDVVEGTFQVLMGTRAEQASRAVNEVIAINNEFRSELVTQKDFDAAKSAIERSFVFKFANPSFVAERAVLLDILGYPQGYDTNYLKNMAAVSREDLKRLANLRIRPQDMVIVIVGRVSAEDIAKEFAGEIDVFRLSFDTVPQVEEKLVNSLPPDEITEQF